MLFSAQAKAKLHRPSIFTTTLLMVSVLVHSSFKNSLHHSTLGALSLAVSSIASGMTVSNGDLSFEMAIDMALASSSSNPILIIGTDVYVEKTLELRKKMYHQKVDFN